MVTVLTGAPGSGKTSQLVALVHEAVERSNGNVICVEHKRNLTYAVSSRARLVSANDYGVKGYDAFYGFLAGICANDHDITDVFVDATLRIGGNRDYGALLAFLKKTAALAQTAETDFVFTISAADADLPPEIFTVCKKFA